jgi:hypothetical protein
VPTKNKPLEQPRDQPTERRGQPRVDGVSADWETIVLKRVERHVKSLSVETTESASPAQDPGWEQSALVALRRRIRDLKSD